MNEEKERSYSNKGFSLILVVVIMFVLSSTMTVFLYTNMGHRNRLSRRLNRMQAFYMASSEMLRATRNLPHSVSVRKDSLFGGCVKSEFEITRGFIRVVSTGIFNQEKVSIQAEYGMQLDESEKDIAAILLAKNRPEIRGFVDGDIKTGHPLPVINLSIIKNEIGSFYTALQSPYQADTELFSPQLFSDRSDFPPNEKIFVNDAVFFKEDTFNFPATVISTSDIIVESGYLSGLTLIAQGEVRIQGDSHLNNVSIFSPAGVVLSGYSNFSGEIISEREIRVGEYATIGGSSVLVARGENNKIRFTESSSFSGTAISIEEIKIGSSHTNLIDIGENVHCYGLIYSSGRVAMKGKLKGLIYAFSFYGRKSNGKFGNAIEGDIVSGVPNNLVISAFLDTERIKRKSWGFTRTRDSLL
ncbi:hypothetical protein KAW48_09265 [candidate division WOR-3 bacterium]|nr:hypothetical protein [candidate division WOR-3 bacterium]